MKSLDDWRPLAQAMLASGELTEDAARVLPHADGTASISEISARAGMEMSDVLVALGMLVQSGVLDTSDAPAELLQIAHLQKRASSVAPPRRPAPPPPLDVPAFDDIESLDALPELEVVGVPTEEDLADLPELEVAGDDASEVPEPTEPAAQGSFRQIFETTLKPLPVDVRVEWAKTGDGDVLSALCMDPVPGVIQAVLENPNTNVTHARLIAEHHRHPVGLDTLGKSTQYLRDSTVRRFLLRNQQASERLLHKMLGSLPLTQVFRANVGHELTDRARRAGRLVLRTKFEQVPSEEKVALIVQTEGRCLANLVGLTLDQKTTALLCRRTYQSSMLIQSLARFPATPPTLITHLLRQQSVVRNATLKKRLLQHPNCPKHLKR